MGIYIVDNKRVTKEEFDGLVKNITKKPNYEENEKSKQMKINLEALKGLQGKYNAFIEEAQKQGVIVSDSKEKLTEFKEGHWYVHTEPGMEAFLIRIDDLDRSLCSGWDCKGNRFYKEYVWLGSRLILATDERVIGYKEEGGQEDLFGMLNNLFSNRLNSKPKFEIYEGLRFIHHITKSEFTVLTIEGEEVTVEWDIYHHTYTKYDAYKFFKEGTWIPIPNKINPRLGRKQEFVVLDDNNNAHEILRFTNKYKHLAPQVVEFIKSIQK